MACLTPYRLKTGEDVPCGRCSPCLKRRANGWSFRLQEHNKWVDSAHFVTLTYDTKFVPLTDTGFMTLKKRDVQLFFKRLRFITAKRSKNVQIKYYACGEYGSKTNRPHYHAIIFNATLEEITDAWKLDGIQLGHVHIDDTNEATINYTIKYMHKPHRVPMFRGDKRTPEFSLMSKGLGLSYITEHAKNYHLVKIDGKIDIDRSRMYLVMPGGFKVAMPRYYKNKMYDEFERAVIAWASGSKARQKAQKEVGNSASLRSFHESIKAACRSFVNASQGRDKV